MVGCKDSKAVRELQGAYRYKTTGKVTLEENYSGATKADTLVANLDNESGTLEVVSLHDKDSLMLTIDQLNGNVIVTRGKVEGSKLVFADYHRTLEVPTTVNDNDTLHIGVGTLTVDTVIVRTKNVYEPYDITVHGYAEIHDNNLIFRMDYMGKSQQTERTLRGKNIVSLAKRN